MEYALLIALVAVALIASLAVLEGGLRTAFQRTAADVSALPSSSSTPPSSPPPSSPPPSSPPPSSPPPSSPPAPTVAPAISAAVPKGQTLVLTLPAPGWPTTWSAIRVTDARADTSARGTASFTGSQVRYASANSDKGTVRLAVTFEYVESGRTLTGVTEVQVAIGK